MKFVIYTDGGARGNPGPAAIGIVIEEVVSHQSSDTLKAESRKLIAENGKRIGEATNNEAEYTAVLEGLRNIKYQISNIKYEDKNNIAIQFYLDSNLVVQQLNGKFKVKGGRLRELLMQVRLLEQEVGGGVSYNYVPREQNRRADFLLNKALDTTPHVSFL